MNRIKVSSFSHLLAPILLIGTLLFAGLVTFFTIRSYNREMENIEDYTHARMKSLILELETKAMSLESAMITAGHMRSVTLDDSTAIYRHMEQLCDDLKFVDMAGVDFWEDIKDDWSISLYVTKTPSGYQHHVENFLDDEVLDIELECLLEAYEAGKPIWSPPYVDPDYSNFCVITCYHRITDKEAMIYSDVKLQLLLQEIDNLQFYEDSRMYVVIPDGTTYSLENGQLIREDRPKYDKKHFAEFAAHYRHLDMDIICIVPKDVVYASMMKGMSLALVLFIIGLAVLAFLVNHSFQNAQKRLAETIEKSNVEEMARKHLEDEISIAARIQNKMLTAPGNPAHFASKKCLPVDVITHITPAREVGGDLYEYRIADGKFIFCIGDVSGKGIPASLVMSRCSTLFHAYVSHANSQNPSDFLLFMNQQLCRRNEELMFVTMWAGTLDLKTGILEYASAAHNPPVLAGPGKAEFLPMAQGLPLGMFEDSEYTILKQKIEPGEAILLYTDGITEAEGPNHVLFGEERLLEVCSAAESRCPEVICTNLLNAVHRHAAGCQQSDDITLLAVSYGLPCAQLLGIGDVKAIHDLVNETVGTSEETVVALEEAAVNVLTHGGATYACLEYKEGEYALYSDGDDFDPTQYVAPAPTGELSIGGRGIHLMRQLCSDITYRRTDGGISILTLKTNI